MDCYGRVPKLLESGKVDGKQDATTLGDDGTYITAEGEIGGISHRTDFVITEESPRITQPGAIVLPLLPTQLASVKAMLEIEARKTYSIESRTYFTSASTLSNAMGSGKTPTLIALIAMSPVPPQAPVTALPINMEQSSGHTKQPATGSRGIIMRKYNRALPVTVMFVGSGVLDQIAREFQRFAPGLRVFVIRDIFSLRKYYTDILYTDQIGKLDVIIVKRGKISGKWDYAHREIVPSGTYSGAYTDIHNIFGYISQHVCYARRIYDDFDTIGMPSVSVNINALHTWFASVTRHEGKGNSIPHYSSKTVEGMLENVWVSYKALLRCDIIHKIFNVKVSDPFHKKFMTVGLPNMYRYLFRDPTQKVAKLINLMAGDKVSAIMEALNGDALEEAAKLAGIESASVTGIFKSLLRKNFDRMAEAARVLESIRKYYSTVNPSHLPKLPDGSDDTFTKKDLREGRRVEWRYPGYRALVEEEEKAWTAEYKELKGCIDKFKDTIKNGDCSVCCCPLEDGEDGCCILPCCFEIIHMGCATNGCRFSSKIVPGTDGKKEVLGNCPFNKSDEVSLASLVYIKKGFDLGELTDESKIAQTIEEEKKQAPADVKTADSIAPVDPDRTKYDAIIDIIMGRIPPERKKSDILIPNLMSGQSLGKPDYMSDDVSEFRMYLTKRGYPESIVRMILQILNPLWSPGVLVYAAYDETLRKIQDVCASRCIEFARVMGTAAQIDETFTKFDSGELNVLLVNSTRYSAGRNLQRGTDLVFSHMLMHGELFQQVAGRLQREGRSSDASFHFMLFETETAQLDALMQ